MFSFQRSNCSYNQLHYVNFLQVDGLFAMPFLYNNAGSSRKTFKTILKKGLTLISWSIYFNIHNQAGCKT
jgi:hypothetical protein